MGVLLLKLGSFREIRFLALDFPGNWRILSIWATNAHGLARISSHNSSTSLTAGGAKAQRKDIIMSSSAKATEDL